MRLPRHTAVSRRAVLRASSYCARTSPRARAQPHFRRGDACDLSRQPQPVHCLADGPLDVSVGASTIDRIDLIFEVAGGYSVCDEEQRVHAFAGAALEAISLFCLLTISETLVDCAKKRWRVKGRWPAGSNRGTPWRGGTGPQSDRSPDYFAAFLGCSQPTGTAAQSERVEATIPSGRPPARAWVLFASNR